MQQGPRVATPLVLHVYLGLLHAELVSADEELAAMLLRELSDKVLPCAKAG